LHGKHLLSPHNESIYKNEKSKYILRGYPVLAAGEVETDEDGVVLRWMSKCSLYLPSMQAMGQSGLPMDKLVVFCSDGLTSAEAKKETEPALISELRAMLGTDDGLFCLSSFRVFHDLMIICSYIYPNTVTHSHTRGGSAGP
jgi:hypothetical protein